MSYKNNHRPTDEFRGLKISLALLLLLMVITVTMFKMIFGQSTEDAKNSDKKIAVTPNKITAPINIDPTQTLNKAVSEGQGEIAGPNGLHGIVKKQMTLDRLHIVSVANLPPVDAASGHYSLWLVQPGLTGYFPAGNYEPRADGLYGLIFDSALANLPPDVDSYKHLMITREQYDNNPLPSQNRVGEGDFNL